MAQRVVDIQNYIKHCRKLRDEEQAAAERIWKEMHQETEPVPVYFENWKALHPEEEPMLVQCKEVGTYVKEVDGSIKEIKDKVKRKYVRKIKKDQEKIEETKSSINPVYIVGQQVAPELTGYTIHIGEETKPIEELENGGKMKKVDTYQVHAQFTPINPDNETKLYVEDPSIFSNTEQLYFRVKHRLVGFEDEFLVYHAGIADTCKKIGCNVDSVTKPFSYASHFNGKCKNFGMAHMHSIWEARIHGANFLRQNFGYEDVICTMEAPIIGSTSSKSHRNALTWSTAVVNDENDISRFMEINRLEDNQIASYSPITQGLSENLIKSLRKLPFRPCLFASKNENSRRIIFNLTSVPDVPSNDNYVYVTLIDLRSLAEICIKLLPGECLIHPTAYVSSQVMSPKDFNAKSGVKVQTTTHNYFILSATYADLKHCQITLIEATKRARNCHDKRSTSDDIYTSTVDPLNSTIAETYSGLMSKLYIPDNEDKAKLQFQRTKGRMSWYYKDESIVQLVHGSRGDYLNSYDDNSDDDESDSSEDELPTRQSKKPRYINLSDFSVSYA